MAGVKDWLNQKFKEWEKAQGKAQSYFAYARYLGVSQTELSAWLSGAAEPTPEEAELLAAKLGPEIHAVMAGHFQGGPQPFDLLTDALMAIPAGLRERLTQVILEAAREIRAQGLLPESLEAKKITVEIFARHGIRLTK